MDILKLIATSSFITVNKELIKRFGLEEAIVLGELASECDYWTKNNGLTEDGYFYSTIENIESNTTLSAHKQRSVLNNLKNNGVIDVKLMGLPAKRYIKLFNNKLLKILISCDEKNEQLDVNIFNTNNNITNNNINDTNIIVEQAILSDSNEQNIVDDIINYLNEVCGTSYRKSTSKTAKAINARIKEGYTFEDFKNVIDLKWKQWGETPTMFSNGVRSDTYLRPSTLFSGNFENYVNEYKKNSNKEVKIVGATKTNYDLTTDLGTMNVDIDDVRKQLFGN